MTIKEEHLPALIPMGFFLANVVLGFALTILFVVLYFQQTREQEQVLRQKMEKLRTTMLDSQLMQQLARIDNYEKNLDKGLQNLMARTSHQNVALLQTAYASGGRQAALATAKTMTTLDNGLVYYVLDEKRHFLFNHTQPLLIGRPAAVIDSTWAKVGQAGADSAFCSINWFPGYSSESHRSLKLYWQKIKPLNWVVACGIFDEELEKRKEKYVLKQLEATIHDLPRNKLVVFQELVMPDNTIGYKRLLASATNQGIDQAEGQLFLDKDRAEELTRQLKTSLPARLDMNVTGCPDAAWVGLFRPYSHWHWLVGLVSDFSEIQGVLETGRDYNRHANSQRLGLSLLIIMAVLIPVTVFFTFIGMHIKRTFINYHNDLQARHTLLEQSYDALKDESDKRTELQTRLNLITENMSDMVVLTDPDGQVMYASPSVTKFLGWHPEILIGHSLFEQIHPDDQPKSKLAVSFDFSSGSGKPFSVRLKHVDGHYLWTEVLPNPALNEKDESLGVVWVARDYTRNKMMRDQIKKTEQISRAVITRSPLAISVRDKTGRLVMYNSAYKNLWNHSEEALAEFCQPREKLIFDDRDSYLGSYLPQVKAVYETGGYVHIPELHLTPNALRPLQAEWISHHFYAVYDDDGRVDKVVVLTENITARKRMEIQMQESEQRYRALVESSDDIIILLKEGKVAFVNDRVVEKLGFTADEMMQMDFKEMVGGTANLNKPHLSGLYETELHKKNGSTLPVELNATVIEYHGGKAVLAFFRDISSRRAAEQELRRLSTAIDQAVEGVVVTDVSGVILYANPAFVRTTGYKRDELLNKKISVIKSNQHDSDFYSALWQTITAGEVWTGHIKNRRKNGELYTDETIISPVRNQTGQIVNYVAVKRDVTRELDLESQVRQSQKLSAVGTLAGGIAHDFNNILQAMIGQTYLLKIEPENNVTGVADELMSLEIRAKSLVERILTFSRQSDLKIEAVDLSKLTREIIMLLKSTFPSSIEFVEEIDELGVLMTDAVQWQQIVMNLCTNARDAMEGRGRLEIKLKQVDETQMGLTKPGLVLMVKDNGSGMNDDVRQRMFEPFYTTKKIGQGTGLGLATVHGIVQSFNGQISVESEPGKGSVFSITLPCITPEDQNA